MSRNLSKLGGVLGLFLFLNTGSDGFPVFGGILFCCVVLVLKELCQVCQNKTTLIGGSLYTVEDGLNI